MDYNSCICGEHLSEAPLACLLHGWSQRAITPPLMIGSELLRAAPQSWTGAQHLVAAVNSSGSPYLSPRPVCTIFYVSHASPVPFRFSRGVWATLIFLFSLWPLLPTLAVYVCFFFTALHVIDSILWKYVKWRNLCSRGVYFSTATQVVPDRVGNQMARLWSQLSFRCSSAVQCSNSVFANLLYSIFSAPFTTKYEFFIIAS